MLGKYCGYVLPPNLVSSTSKVFIHFQSDAYVTENGFKLEYNTIGTTGVQPTTLTAMTSSTATIIFTTTAMTSTTSTSNAIETIDKRWRDDNRCGINYPLPDGTLAQCNPDGVYPCCSNHDWCGNTYDHCACTGCIDYREGMQC